jgi:hypothetical protein
VRADPRRSAQVDGEVRDEDGARHVSHKGLDDVLHRSGDVPPRAVRKQLPVQFQHASRDVHLVPIDALGVPEGFRKGERTPLQRRGDDGGRGPVRLHRRRRHLDQLARQAPHLRASGPGEHGLQRRELGEMRRVGPVAAEVDRQLEDGRQPGDQQPLQMLRRRDPQARPTQTWMGGDELADGRDVRELAEDWRRNFTCSVAPQSLAERRTHRLPRLYDQGRRQIRRHPGCRRHHDRAPA